MRTKKYLKLKEHYEECLQKYGDNYLGVDWPNVEDVQTRYKVMLDVIKVHQEKITLLDFGCGASHFYEYILDKKVRNIHYVGLDISKKYIDLCRGKYPENQYLCIDIIDKHDQLPVYDYIIMNGVFTEKTGLTFYEMFDFFKKVLKIVYSKINIALSFNVMSKHVDWERDDLFHLSFDMLANFLTEELTRDFIFRNDYGLYEYSTYVYK